MTGTATDDTAQGGTMQIALALYPNFTMLDIIGPFQVLADVPGHEVVFVAAEAGPVVDHTGRATLIATKSFADVAEPDIVVVPGGLGDTEIQPELVDWLRAVHPTTTWTTSVCTGAIYLAVAGILDGLDATTHWARKRVLEQLGAHYSTERVVERGKVITAAGVSSGIDMALVLLDRMYGPEIAQMIQLAIEYDPQPPFDAGSPAKAPAALVELVQQRIGEGPALPATTTGGSR
jgi:transcriptional regulator GlxA family with amidase domain